MQHEKKVTIKDIAQECGVSLSTVSLVLNNNPRISDSTRQKVLDAVRKNDYQPNNSARGLASRSSLTISVVVPHLGHVFADVYFGEIISGIYEEASANNYKVLLDIANHKFIQTEEYMSILRSRRADGMLFIGSKIGDEFPFKLENSPYPFLLVNHMFPESNLNYITVDYADSARKAAEHLLGLGHRHIGLIEGCNTHSGLLFSKTFMKCCAETGVARDQIHTYDGGQGWNLEGGFLAAQSLLDDHPEITCIMAGNDRMAIGAISYLKKIGKRVPEDISVMGVDDIHAAAFSTPGLTTIWHDLYQLGKMSFSRLLAMHRGQINSCAETLPVTLIERASTAPAPQPQV